MTTATPAADGAATPAEATSGASMAPVGGGAVTPAAGGATPDGGATRGGGRPVEGAPGLARFSFNQATTQGWPLPDLVDALVRSGVPGIGLWREPVADYGLEKTARLVRDAGIAVTSLCRGGFFADAGWYDENRRAIDEAAALGTSVLVLVSGGLGGRDLAGARVHVADAIGRLVPHAREVGVTLAIEPLHPMFCSDRCVISTLDQALAIAERHEVGEVGVVVDTYHLWWDDRAPALVRRAGPRVSAFQLADWITPLPAGVLTGRGMPGTGCIDLPAWVSYADSSGYTGPIEIEVFNTEVWARPGADVLAEAVAGFRAATAASTP
ncbi:xylose isomerase [Virgisporangium ochraceum]|uniref:Xylose isomerase n=1 Tax=Virgisporangium ochraceum TaxID=65505 RepID=A0A8J4ECY5_9ACTN|nr:sugar phosphate isomerase/epimerase family protein [Virgisporangium ochraceum]GIJ67377.1 xylose isomerase [Virgisporangium ochraceum]